MEQSHTNTCPVNFYAAGLRVDGINSDDLEAIVAWFIDHGVNASAIEPWLDEIVSAARRLDKLT